MDGINIVVNGNNDLIEKMNKMLSHRGVSSNINSYFQGKVQVGYVYNLETLSEFDHPISNNISIHSSLIYISTDYLATKPLYIRKEGNLTAISSEIKPLKLIKSVTPDKLYFSMVAKWGYCSHNRTPYEQIKKISANMLLKINPLKNKINFYSLPPLVPVKRDIRKELITIVKKCIVKDVPNVLLLSGGLDSTIIFQLMKQFTKDFTVFHIDNEEAEYLNYLDFSGIKVKQLELKEIDLKGMLYWNECPVDLGSAIQQYQLGEALKKAGFFTTISGDGADELFGGYRRINDYDSQYSDIFDELQFYHIPRLDKLMSANGITLYCPYLEKFIIEGALALPYEERKNKLHLKKIFADIVPKEILNRKKKPLRSDMIKEVRFQHRLKLIELFIEENF